MRGPSLKTSCNDSSPGREGGARASRAWVLGWIVALGLVCGACSDDSSSPQDGTGRPRPIAGSGASAGLTENRPAVVLSARLQPDPLTRREPISVIVEAEDPDGGAVTITHQWFRNGEPLEGQTNPTLSPDLVERGDQVSVEITPFDAKGPGAPFRTSGDPVVNTPPEVTRIVYKPFPLRVGERVVATVESEDPDGDNVSYQFRWFHNGEEYLRANYDAISTADFARGDEIVVEAIPSDGIEDGPAWRSDPVRIENSPPEITSQPPGEFVDGLFAYVVRASDRDGDELTFSLDAAPPGMTIDPKTGALQWQITRQVAGTHDVRIAVDDGHVAEPTVQEFTLGLTPKADES